MSKIVHRKVWYVTSKGALNINRIQKYRWICHLDWADKIKVIKGREYQEVIDALLDLVHEYGAVITSFPQKGTGNLESVIKLNTLNRYEDQHGE